MKSLELKLSILVVEAKKTGCCAFMKFIDIEAANVYNNIKR